MQVKRTGQISVDVLLIFAALCFLAMALAVVGCDGRIEASSPTATPQNGRWQAVGGATNSQVITLDTQTGDLLVTMLRIPEPLVVRFSVVDAAQDAKTVKLPPAEAAPAAPAVVAPSPTVAPVAKKR